MILLLRCLLILPDSVQVERQGKWEISSILYHTHLRLSSEIMFFLFPPAAA